MAYVERAMEVAGVNQLEEAKFKVSLSFWLAERALPAGTTKRSPWWGGWRGVNPALGWPTHLRLAQTAA